MSPPPPPPPPVFFGEQRNLVTGEQMPNFRGIGEQRQYWGTGNIRKQNFDFWGTSQFISGEQGNSPPPPPTPPHTHTHWEGLNDCYKIKYYTFFNHFVCVCVCVCVCFFFLSLSFLYFFLLLIIYFISFLLSSPFKIENNILTRSAVAFVSWMKLFLQELSILKFQLAAIFGPCPF